MSRIVIDARELRTSSGRYVERLLHYLQKIDHHNEYIVLLKPSEIATWHPTNPNFGSVSCPHKEFSFGEQLGLYKQIRSLKPDLVHFTFPQQPIRYSGKTVTTIHDLTTLRFHNPDKNAVVFKAKQRVYQHVIKRAARRSEEVVVPSEFVRDDVAKFAGLNGDKFIVTYEAAEPITHAAEPVESLAGKKFLMYVGRPTPHKNLPRLIEAFGLLRTKHPKLLLVLAGKKDANYSRIAKTEQPGIVFTGLVSEGQLRWLYENCAAYAFPSMSEGFGLPGLEAMVHGAPVVSSNATCLPEIYGDAAIYFDPTSIDQMTGAIERVLTDPELRSRLISKGHTQSQKYSWERMATQTLEAYQRALAN